MGSLQAFDLAGLVKRYSTPFFFETGTWKGDGLYYASLFPFKKLYSSEVVPEFADAARKRFSSDVRVNIINKDSVSAFREVLGEMNGNCIFWLDAHYPAADQGIKDYNDELEEQVRLPLEEEINLLAARIPRYNDVLLIDDLRIYENGPYQYGNIPETIIPPRNRNINFVLEKFGITHNVFRSFKSEGYLIVVPKSIPVPGLIHRLMLKFRKKIF